jgi:hypothetical protein
MNDFDILLKKGSVPTDLKTFGRQTFGRESWQYVEICQPVHRPVSLCVGQK